MKIIIHVDDKSYRQHAQEQEGDVAHVASYVCQDLCDAIRRDADKIAQRILAGGAPVVLAVGDTYAQL